MQTYDVCPGADNTDEQALFLNTFRNQYDRPGGSTVRISTLT